MSSAEIDSLWRVADDLELDYNLVLPVLRKLKKSGEASPA